MKTIFTLLFVVGAVASSFAQNQRDWNDHAGQNNPNVRTDPTGVYDRNNDRYNNPNQATWNNQNGHYNNNANYGYAQRDMQIANINRNIDFRIQQVMNDPYMNRRQKRREIESLQAQKAQQIQACNSQYNNGYNRNGNDRDDRRGGYDRDDQNRLPNQNRNWNR